MRCLAVFRFATDTDTVGVEFGYSDYWRILHASEHTDVEATLKDLEGQHQALNDYRKGRICIVEVRKKVRTSIALTHCFRETHPNS